MSMLALALASMTAPPAAEGNLLRGQVHVQFQFIGRTPKSIHVDSGPYAHQGSSQSPGKTHLIFADDLPSDLVVPIVLDYGEFKHNLYALPAKTRATPYPIPLKYTPAGTCSADGALAIYTSSKAIDAPTAAEASLKASKGLSTSYCKEGLNRNLLLKARHYGECTLATRSESFIVSPVTPALSGDKELVKYLDDCRNVVLQTVAGGLGVENYELAVAAPPAHRDYDRARQAAAYLGTFEGLEAIAEQYSAAATASQNAYIASLEDSVVDDAAEEEMMMSPSEEDMDVEGMAIEDDMVDENMVDEDMSGADAMER